MLTDAQLGMNECTGPSSSGSAWAGELAHLDEARCGALARSRGTS
jgi:hypothetical protein